MNYSVDLQIDVDNADLPSAESVERWVTTALEGRRDRGEICIRIVTPEESQTLNREYRGKDKPTNVLSFPFDVPPGIPMDLLGDLAICADVVAEEAVEQEKSLQDHWAHMVIHGTLHLLGFDHINDDEAEEMEALERDLLARLGIADPYAEPN
ncbi:rRNA maturation RNase YbeY [Marinobacterium mangrovicola]|uniref:Endoribonuclease YbeY n=1 Tax=Marinobacterium mangrovicola TaxID=1476959 RepID=A0A4R1GJ57_9GAMM|nr:rRNA maturation RNase YbeY [Marinobacterium mangrovicola]TCK06895.1 putative rRNA maturation factor [Marinobacterium mangrovicola]